MMMMLWLSDVVESIENDRVMYKLSVQPAAAAADAVGKMISDRISRWTVVPAKSPFLFPHNPLTSPHDNLIPDPQRAVLRTT